MSITGQVSVSVDLSALDAWLLDTPLKIEALIATTAGLIVEEMKRLAPYDDDPKRPDGPHLRDSITSHLSDLAVEITAGENLPDGRAIFNEYGTHKMAAQPYFRPTMERYVPAFLAELQVIVGG